MRAKKKHRGNSESPGFVLGRARFTKISAVEGLVLSDASKRMFAEFDRQNLTPEQRRAAILRKHTAKAT